MYQKLLTIRYYLEMVALPAFIFLVIHLAGEGVMFLLGEGHDHSHHHHHDHGGMMSSWLEWFMGAEFWAGLILLVLFTWIWHRPSFRRWVPCTHDHCHGELPIPHVLATVALCLHFFPEAGIRQELLYGAFENGSLYWIGFIGFLAHFFVDVIVAVVLSSYWKTRLGFFLSLGTIVLCWLVAFFLAHSSLMAMPPFAEGLLFIVSAFLLAMFVHKPHKPVPCQQCD